MSDIQHPAFRGKSYDDFHSAAPRDEAREAAVVRAIAAVWVEMMGPSFSQPPTEADSPSLWRQVRVAVDAVLAAAPRADPDVWEQAAQLVERPMSGDSPRWTVNDFRKVMAMRLRAVARAPGREP